MQIAQTMLRPGQFPIVKKDTMLKEALVTMDQYRLGIACITDEDGRLLGLITDGDLRRRLLKIQKPFAALFADDVLRHAICDPVTIDLESSLHAAIKLMGERQIWDLPVVNKQKELIGLLHLHATLQAVMESPLTQGE